MTLGLRKTLLLVLVGGICFMANVVVVANWLSNSGVSDFAQTVKSNYPTGTAITIIVTLLILLAGPKKTTSRKIMSFLSEDVLCVTIG